MQFGGNFPKSSTVNQKLFFETKSFLTRKAHISPFYLTIRQSLLRSISSFRIMNPIVRSAQISDLEALKKFQQQLVIHERPFDHGIPKKGEVEYYNLKVLLEADAVNFLVAEVENSIVGCGFGQIRKNDPWSVNQYFGYIGLMYVDKRFRNQKVGRLLVNALIKWFKEKNVFDIRLKV